MILSDDHMKEILDEWNKVGELYRDLHRATGINYKNPLRDMANSPKYSIGYEEYLDSMEGLTVAQRNTMMMGNWREEADTKTIKGHSHNKDSGVPEVDVTRSDAAYAPAQFGDGIFITAKSSSKRYHTQLNGVVVNSETGVAKDSDIDFSKIRIWE